MNMAFVRFVHVLFVTLLMVMGAVAPASAQTKPAPEEVQQVRLFMQDGWRSFGRHAAADDFVLECPILEVLDPAHPCSEANDRFPKGNFDDFVLVCPIQEVLDPNHPCFDRRSQIKHATADDLVLVCPIKEVLDPSHPCAEQNLVKGKFQMPKDFVMTCPIKEVLDPYHPCFR